MSWHILKDCESLPCLQEQEEVSSEAICWDGEQFVPSSGPTTLGGYCLPDSETGCCLDSQSGMMSKHSTEAPGEDESMSSQAVSHARTSAQPAKELESTARDPECGSTWPGSFARYDRDSSLWKTPQCSLLEGLDVFSETWPRWGTMRNGACWELMTLAPRTNEIESGLLPTPLASIATHGGPNQRDSSGRPGLQMAAMMWPTPSSHKQTASGDLVNRDGTTWDGVSKPHSKATGKPVQTALLDKIKYSTPTVNDAKNSSLPPSQINRDSLVSNVMRWPTPRAGNPGSRPNGKGGKILAEEVKKLEESIPVGGQLNPTWVEWLMGWPIEWTDLKPLGMAKFRSWQQQHSGF